MPLLAALVLIGVAGLLPRAETHSFWEGTWTLFVGKESSEKLARCDAVEPVVKQFKVTLNCPDVAVDEFGNEGYWTSQSFIAVEIVIQGRKFYSSLRPRGSGIMSPTTSNYFGNSTNQRINVMIAPGWSHDLLGNNWACFSGIRSFSDGEPKPESEPQRDAPSKPLLFKKWTESSGSQLYRTDHELIAAINQGQSFWTARRYPQFENMTKDDMINMAGGKYSLIPEFVKPGILTEAQKNATWFLPKHWDWRNVRGQNFVSPVRAQGFCGSCYAFAAIAMYESRVRILTNNLVATTYSPQDAVDCNPYAFGCGGGFALSQMKYEEDYGYAEEACNPYQAVKNTCTSLDRCKRSYATDYELIGSHTGGCNDLAMQLAVYQRGPIVAGFAVYQDFRTYGGGIYYHYGPDQFLGGHAVTVVGWGEDEKTETKYWIVKNSWGSNWGENGYFRIIRGLNECNFESTARESSPIL